MRGLSAFLLVATGLGMAVPGLYLTVLGGSLYYVIAGLLILVSAWLVWRGRDSGVTLYWLVYLGTIVWSLAEVGLDAWALMPRLVFLGAGGIWLLFVPSKGWPARCRLTAIIFCVLLAGALLYAVVPWPAGASVMPVVAGVAGDGVGEWAHYGNSPYGTRYSALAQITPANVATLKPAWVFHMRPPDDTRGFASSENTPLVIKGVMYLATPYGRVVALDAVTGQERWAYQVPHGDQPATRGVSYWPGAKPRIVFGTRGGLLIALDAGTGAPASGFGKDGVVDLHSDAVMQGFPHAFLSITSAPVIYKDLIITGSRTQEVPQQGASGQVRAFDVRTGHEVWHFNGVPQPGEKFHDTWEGDSWVKRSGVNVWAGLTLDAKRGIAYLPFGAPAFDQSGNDRKGASLYGTPMTYSVGGKQYLAAVVTGGFWGERAGADDVMVFALP